MKASVPTSRTGTHPFPLGEALLVVGDRWNLQIVRAGFQGIGRFQSLRDELAISDAVLAQRLRSLVTDGILRPEQYSDSPPRHEYRLTDAGKDLWAVFVALWTWDRRWAPEADGALGTHLRHTTCGHAITPVFGCGSCGAIGVTARDTATRFDASADLGVARRSRRSSAGDVLVDSTVVLADRWSTFLLAAALRGARRFGDFQRHLPGISPLTLTDRLGAFVESAMLARVPVSEGKGRHEYRLTPKGLEFFTVFAFVNQWSERWIATDGHSGLVITHRACGQHLRPRFTCNACNQELTRTETEFEILVTAAQRTRK